MSEAVAPEGGQKAASVDRLGALLARVKRGVRPQLSLRTLNILLVLAIVWLVYFIFGSFSTSFALLDKGPLKAPPQSKAGAPEDIAALKPLEFYEDVITARDIFSAVTRKVELPEEPSSKAMEAMGTLRLVGISWSQSPDVIIEDTKTQKTYFLKKDQNIGDVKVETIFKDKVLLRYKEDLVELK